MRIKQAIFTAALVSLVGCGEGAAPSSTTEFHTLAQAVTRYDDPANPVNRYIKTTCPNPADVSTCFATYPSQVMPDGSESSLTFRSDADDRRPVDIWNDLTRSSMSPPEPNSRTGLFVKNPNNRAINVRFSWATREVTLDPNHALNIHFDELFEGLPVFHGEVTGWVSLHNGGVAEKGLIVFSHTGIFYQDASYYLQ